MIFRGNNDEIDPYVAFKRVPQPQTGGNRRILFAADRQPERKHRVQQAALEEGRPGKHNERNGIESRDQKGNFNNMSGWKTTIQSLQGHFDPLAISELTDHANLSSSSPKATIQYKHCYGEHIKCK
mgnify:CR=1 FL=1